MPRYLTLFKYSTEGTKGFLKEKAAAREAALRRGSKASAENWNRSIGRTRANTTA